MHSGRVPGQSVSVKASTSLTLSKHQRFYIRHREEILLKRREAYALNPEPQRTKCRERYRRAA